MKKGSKIGNLKQENTYEGKIKKPKNTYFLAPQTSSFCYTSQTKAFGTGNEMTIILFNLGLNSKFKSAPGYDLHGSLDQIL